MDEKILNDLADAGFELKGIRSLIQLLGESSTESNMRHALNVLANSIAGVEERLDGILRMPAE